MKQFIRRTLTPKLQEFATQFPAVAILGPRQSGKTTLAQQTFSKHNYVSLENADVRSMALADPRLFLASIQNEHGVILDEFQHVPVLLSYLQGIIDKEYKPGYFILTGSQNFLLNKAISQSLAGRVGILTLLPFSIDELREAELLPATIDNAMFSGGYPRIYTQNFTPTNLYPSYIQTYVERDVRQLKNITDLSLFQKFLQLCAGRIGQILNVTSIADGCGISVPTVQSWISILEASYIAFVLQPYNKNFNKRLIKSPKLYFYDSGLACSLLGITSPEQLMQHYLRGGLVESFIISDIVKYFHHRGERPRVFFWRDSQGDEVDCLVEHGLDLIPIEIKSSQTMSMNHFSGVKKWLKIADLTTGYVIYGGDQNFKMDQGALLNWRSVSEIFSKP